MQVIINQMIQLFLVIGIGYFLNKRKLLDAYMNKKISTLLLSVTTPAMILHSVFSQTQQQPLEQVIDVFVITIVMYLLLPVLSYFLVKVMKVKIQEQGLFIFMTVFSNVAFMGFPVIQSIFGSQAIFYAAIVNMGFNTFIFSLGVVLIHYGLDTKVKINCKSLLNPGVVSSLIAITCYLLQIKAPSLLVQTCGMIGGLTTPLAMLLIGSSLALIPLKEVFNDKRIYVYTIIRQIIIPVFAYYVLRLFIKDEYVLGILFIIIAMPVANSAVLFATQYDLQSDLASKAVFITTLTSVVTIPGLVYLFLL